MENLVGMVFGKLTILEVFKKKTTDKQGRRRFCRCLCECGSIVDMELYSVKKGRSTSCGCNKCNSVDPNVTSRNFPSEYNAWNHAKDRCYNPNSDGYPFYGLKGTKVCDRWLEERGFENFLLDMGEKPEPKKDYEIDRISNEGNYCPENCRWVTSEEQSKNRDNIIHYTWEGKTLTLREWAEEKNIKLATLQTRYHTDHKRGEELFAPTRKRKTERNLKDIYIEYNGERRSIPEWSLYTGIDPRTIAWRYDAKWSPEDILTTPLMERLDAGSIKNIILTHNGMSLTLGQWAEYLGKNYDTLKNRYLSKMSVEQILSDEVYPPGRNNLRGEDNKHIGERFGKVIIKDVVTRDRGRGNRSYAICDCDCGVTEKEILLSDLIHDRQKSCGCGRGGKVETTEGNSEKKYSIKGIVGKKFDRLTVLEVIKGKTEKGNYVYRLRCACDCGNETTINLSHLNVIKSCGCYHKESIKEHRMTVTSERLKEVKESKEKEFPFWAMDENSTHVGEKFNKLIIKEVRIKNTEGGARKYAKCLCDCGKEDIKKLYDVTSGKTKSCGCIKKDVANAMSKNNSLEVAGTKFCKVGDVFGNFIVKEIYKRKNNIYAMCDVESGGEKEIRVDHLSRKINTALKQK